MKTGIPLQMTHQVLFVTSKFGRSKFGRTFSVDLEDFYIYRLENLRKRENNQLNL